MCLNHANRQEAAALRPEPEWGPNSERERKSDGHWSLDFGEASEWLHWLWRRKWEKGKRESVSNKPETTICTKEGPRDRKSEGEGRERDLLVSGASHLTNVRYNRFALKCHSSEGSISNRSCDRFRAREEDQFRRGRRGREGKEGKKKKAERCGKWENKSERVEERNGNGLGAFERVC